MTPEDIRLIKYFWLEKGDLTRWSDFAQKEADIERECPHLIAAYRNLITAEKLMDAIVRGLPDPD